MSAKCYLEFVHHTFNEQKFSSVEVLRPQSQTGAISGMLRLVLSKAGKPTEEENNTNSLTSKFCDLIYSQKKEVI